MADEGAVISIPDLDSALRREVAAVEAIKSRTPWMAFEDLVLRRKPSHKKTADEAFTEHGLILAALLAISARRGDLSADLGAQIDLVLKLSKLRDWFTSHPELELLKLLPLPDPLGSVIELPRNATLGRLMTQRMVGLARDVLREHEMSSATSRGGAARRAGRAGA